MGIVIISVDVLAVLTKSKDTKTAIVTRHVCALDGTAGQTNDLEDRRAYIILLYLGIGLQVYNVNLVVTTIIIDNNNNRDNNY